VLNTEKLTIVRNLPDNIEHQRKLLTFTAWYAIIKNNLFPGEDMLCILEWDVDIPAIETFSRITQDVGVFFVDDGTNFMNDVNARVLHNYLVLKGISYPNVRSAWGCTSNYVMRRNILKSFVDFYYPSCIEHIQSFDNAKLSWYHERIFWIFLTHTCPSKICIPGAKHIQSGSHQLTFNR